MSNQPAAAISSEPTITATGGGSKVLDDGAIQTRQRANSIIREQANPGATPVKTVKVVGFFESERIRLFPQPKRRSAEAPDTTPPVDTTVKASQPVPSSATDKLRTAIGKLEKRVSELTAHVVKDRQFIKDTSESDTAGLAEIGLEQDERELEQVKIRLEDKRRELDNLEGKAKSSPPPVDTTVKTSRPVQSSATDKLRKEIGKLEKQVSKLTALIQDNNKIIEDTPKSEPAAVQAKVDRDMDSIALDLLSSRLQTRKLELEKLEGRSVLPVPPSAMDELRTAIGKMEERVSVLTALIQDNNKIIAAAQARVELDIYSKELELLSSSLHTSKLELEKLEGRSVDTTVKASQPVQSSATDKLTAAQVSGATDEIPALKQDLAAKRKIRDELLKKSGKDWAKSWIPGKGMPTAEDVGRLKTAQSQFTEALRKLSKAQKGQGPTATKG